MVGLEGDKGANINGPSVIRVPEWVVNPLGRYYLYFAHHRGTYIRLAYADAIDGPWSIYSPGTLRLEDAPCHDHVASPDVHVDNQHREIRMYFHGISKTQGQVSYLASSSDGIKFRSNDEILGPFYFRVFSHDGYYYAVAKNGNVDGVILRSQSGRGGFAEGLHLIPRIRHTAILYGGNYIDLFYSRAEDAPERILRARIPLTDDWWEWKPLEPELVLEPEEPYEGADLKIEASRFGGAWRRVRQLRDPCIFVDKESEYLFYSVTGEGGIAVAKLTG